MTSFTRVSAQLSRRILLTWVSEFLSDLKRVEALITLSPISFSITPTCVAINLDVVL